MAASTLPPTARLALAIALLHPVGNGAAAAAAPRHRQAERVEVAMDEKAQYSLLTHPLPSVHKAKHAQRPIMRTEASGAVAREAAPPAEAKVALQADYDDSDDDRASVKVQERLGAKKHSRKKPTHAKGNKGHPHRDPADDATDEVEAAESPSYEKPPSKPARTEADDSDDVEAAEAPAADADDAADATTTATNAANAANATSSTNAANSTNSTNATNASNESSAADEGATKAALQEAKFRGILLGVLLGFITAGCVGGGLYYYNSSKSRDPEYEGDYSTLPGDQYQDQYDSYGGQSHEEGHYEDAGGAGAQAQAAAR